MGMRHSEIAFATFQSKHTHTHTHTHINHTHTRTDARTHARTHTHTHTHVFTSKFRVTGAQMSYEYWRTVAKEAFYSNSNDCVTFARWAMGRCFLLRTRFSIYLSTRWLICYSQHRSLYSGYYFKRNAEIVPFIPATRIMWLCGTYTNVPSCRGLRHIPSVLAALKTPSTIASRATSSHRRDMTEILVKAT